MKHQADPDTIARLCASLHDDDGAEEAARLRHRSSRKKSSRDFRKRAQLISQITQTLHLFLSERDDPMLLGLSLSHLEPAPDASHLRAIVHAPPPAPDEPPVELDTLQRRLDALSGIARVEVAAAIHRKKTPLISFLVLPAE